MTAYVHPSAVVETEVIGDNCRIWHDVHIRHGAWIGQGVSIGKGAYIDTGVYVGELTKIQNYACVYRGVTLGRQVFIGPHACFTNDLHPRAVGEWDVIETIVEDGASIGANATIVCGVRIGPHAMVGAAAVVTHDVPAHGKVLGNPAHLVGFVCTCGRPLQHSVALVDGGYRPLLEGDAGEAGAGQEDLGLRDGHPRLGLRDAADDPPGLLRTERQREGRGEGEGKQVVTELHDVPSWEMR